MNNKKLLASFTLVILGTALLLTQFLGQNAQAVLVKRTIVDKQMELSGIQGKFVTFTIPKGVSDVYLSGKTKVVGGILTHILIALFYAKNCPATGPNFLQCKPITYGFYDNNNSFGLYIPSGQKYYIVFQNTAVLGEHKIIKPTVTVSYNK
jgi:hypothetical protein